MKKKWEKILSLEIKPADIDLAGGLLAVVFAVVAFVATLGTKSFSNSVIGPKTVPQIFSAIVFVLGWSIVIRWVVKRGKAKNVHAQYVPEEHTYEIGVMNRYIAKMKRQGWLCTLNHPGWSLQTTEEINGIIGADGFEVYNHKNVVHVAQNGFLKKARKFPSVICRPRRKYNSTIGPRMKPRMTGESGNSVLLSA